MLRRSMLAAIGLLAGLPRSLLAAPRKRKVVDYRAKFEVDRLVDGNIAVLRDARVEVRRPKGWVTRPAGDGAFAMANSEPGPNGALFVTHLPLTKLMARAPVGVVLEDVARKLLGRFGGYRKGSGKLRWEVVDLPMAYRRNLGRAGRMVAQAKTTDGGLVKGYLGVVLERGRIYAVAGFWDASVNEDFLPAADTMFATMKTR